MVQAPSDDFGHVGEVRAKSAWEPLAEQPVGVI